MLADILFIFWLIIMISYVFLHDKIDDKILKIYCKYKVGVFDFWRF